MERMEFGRTGLRLPRIVFGVSALGNLYRALPESTKEAILAESVRRAGSPTAFDTAGKYGAGLALEVMGRVFKKLGIPPETVVISNKLGWRRVPLQAAEPVFEPGVWAELDHDAEQCIGYDGILACWEQGCELLGAYRPSLVSVHDPDEYLAAAGSPEERAQRLDDIRHAYRALHELKARGEARGVGVGAKDWTVIRELHEAVELDWVMFANSFTVMRHPDSLIDFIAKLAREGVGIINSAVFHGGFLTGGAFFDYRAMDETDPADRAIYDWRTRFQGLCRRFGVSPAVACVQFGLSAPGIHGIALNTSRPERVQANVASVRAVVPRAFWEAMRAESLIAPDYPYLDGKGQTP